MAIAKQVLQISSKSMTPTIGNTKISKINPTQQQQRRSKAVAENFKSWIVNGDVTRRGGRNGFITVPWGNSVRLDQIIGRPLPLVLASQITVDVEASSRLVLETTPDSAPRTGHVNHHEERQSELAKLSKQRVDMIKPKGLPNKRNSCFRRSILQAILHIPRVLSWLREVHTTHLREQTHRKLFDCLACSLHHLATELWSPNSTGIARATNIVDEAVDCKIDHSIHLWAGKKGRHNVQACAHEYLVQVIDILKRSKSNSTRDGVIIPALFQVRYAPHLNCQQCHKKHTPSEVDETGFQLDIERGVVNILEDMISRWWKDEIDYRCDQIPKYHTICTNPNPCSNLDECPHEKKQSPTETVRVSRAYKMHAAPELLFMHIRRVVADRTGRHTMLLHEHIRYPRHLDMSKYFVKKDQHGPGHLRYRLSSVVAFQGSVKDGHYITYADNGSGRVNLINDSLVSPVHADEMFRPVGGFMPYILTYVRSP